MRASSDQTRTLRGSNSVGVRQFNERTLLRALHRHGPMPKADLARLTKLSSQTVALIVERLMTDGLLDKQARIRGKLGQPSVPLALRADGAYSLGVHVGRRGLEVVLTDFHGRMRAQWEHLYPYPSTATVLSCVRDSLKHARKHLGPAWSRVVGLGLCTPLSMPAWGALMGAEATDALRDWSETQLTQTLRSITKLPVEFAKDTTAACVAELVQGHGQMISHFLYLFVGTFVGGGLVLDGHIVPGPRGNAGAVGSMPLDGLGRRTPPQLLQHASGWPLEQALIAQGADAQLLKRDDVMSPAFASVRNAWLKVASQTLAMTITSATALLDLDAVVLDGSLSPALMTELRSRTRAQLAHFNLDGIHAPQLLAGRIGAQARALGSSLLPFYAQFFPDKDIFLKPDA